MRSLLQRAAVCAATSLVACLCGCAEPPVPAPLDPDYAAELDEWKRTRDENLRRNDGWLTVVGLSWLEEGVNSLGADPASTVVFPEGVDRHLGQIIVEGESPILEAASDSGIRHRDSEVTTLALETDASGEPTMLTLDSLSFYVIDRAGRLGVRIKDSEAPALTHFSGMDYFPVDARWRIRASFEAFEEPRTIKVPNVVGTAFEEPVPGIVSFEVDGRIFELTPIGEQDGQFFIVFGDETNGTETYGGGRFLYTDPPSPDGTIELDFNAAYNPPCVFTPFATCPLPPPGNRLAIEVRAGEKTYGAPH